MHIRKKGFKINIGKGVGNELEELLIKAKKKVWIISPWISKKYAKLLLKKKESGTDVKLITTTSYTNKDHLCGILSLIRTKEVRDKSRYKFYTWLMYGSIPLIFLFGIGIITLILFWYLRKQYSWLEFESPIGLKIYKTVYADKVPNEFIHTKMYIIDKYFCLGSVNLTNKGLWDNMESFIVFDNKDVLKKGEEDFSSLFKHPLLREKKLDELGLSEFIRSSKK